MTMGEGMQVAPPRAVRVSYAGVTRDATEDTWQGVADALREQYGAEHGVPNVVFVGAETVSAVAAPAADPLELDLEGLVEPIEPEPPTMPSRNMAPRVAVPATMVAGPDGMIDVAGLARCDVDRAAAVASGFSPRATVFARGTRVLPEGDDRARELRAEFDAMPLVSAALPAFADRVRSEARRMVQVAVPDVRMDVAGRIVVPGEDPFRVSKLAFRGMLNRLGYGGYYYLTESCDPSLRAFNVNAQADMLGAKGITRKLSLRVRKNRADGGENCFAVVTPRYTVFDVDSVAEALCRATPAGARARVRYDGERATMEALFHHVVPEHSVAGEFFRAGVRVRASDCGDGGVSVQAVVWQNLCLNFLIIDEAVLDIETLAHVGDVEELAEEFRTAMARAFKAIEHFIVRWGYACTADVLITARRAAASDGLADDYVPIPVSAALPGIFNGLIQEQRIPVARSSVPVVVPQLVAAWEGDASGARKHRDAPGLSLASVVNAITRYAHTEPQSTTWDADALERAAGVLLGSRGPLRYVPLGIDK